jgi:hypothetical protein
MLRPLWFCVEALGRRMADPDPFFAFAILLMLLWTPRLDVPEAS